MNIFSSLKKAHNALPKHKKYRTLPRRRLGSTSQLSSNLLSSSRDCVRERISQLRKTDSVVPIDVQDRWSRDPLQTNGTWGAGAVYGALRKDWKGGIRILRSLQVRALDVTVDDALAVSKFFELNEALAVQYLKISSRYLGLYLHDHRRKLRKPAYEAMRAFREAREALVRKQTPRRVANVVATAREARSTMLRVTRSEGSYRMPLDMIAQKMMETELGPYLIILLTRGVSKKHEVGRLIWARQTLFPQKAEHLGTLLMFWMVQKMAKDHWGYVGLFKTAEREYRFVCDIRLPKERSGLFGNLLYGLNDSRNSQ